MFPVKKKSVAKSAPTLSTAYESFSYAAREDDRLWKWRGAEARTAEMAMGGLQTCRLFRGDLQATSVRQNALSTWKRIAAGLHMFGEALQEDVWTESISVNPCPHPLLNASRDG